MLAMRWNGNKENPLGNPQSRGLSTWFIVPINIGDRSWKMNHSNLSTEMQ